MKKIHELQIMVYIAFALFISQNVAGDVYRGFIDGWNDYNSDTSWGNNATKGPVMYTVITSPQITNKLAEANTDTSYTLSNISMNAEMQLKGGADATPDWFILIKVFLAIVVFTTLLRIAVTINKIIKIIFAGTMFNDYCIKQLNKVGVLLAVFAFIDYAYQRLILYQQTLVVKAPLTVVSTVNFKFEVLICAILVFIVARAFKQGASLKHEQDLTI